MKLNLLLKKHANYIQSSDQIILSLDLYLFSNHKNIKEFLNYNKNMKESLANITMPKDFTIEFIPYFDMYIEIIKETLLQNTEYTKINKNFVYIKSEEITKIQEILNNIEFPEIKELKHTITLKKDSKTYIKIILNNNMFYIEHKGFSKILSNYKYKKLTNICNLSLYINANNIKKADFIFYTKNKKSVYSLYINYILNLL